MGKKRKAATFAMQIAELGVPVGSSEGGAVARTRQRWRSLPLPPSSDSHSHPLKWLHL